MTKFKTLLTAVVAVASLATIDNLTQQNATAKTSKWENLSEGEYVPLTSKTTTPEKMARTWKQQYYYSAKQVHGKVGVMDTYIVKLTKSGKGSYFHHWGGTKKHPYKHLIENNKYNKVYKTKLKGLYGFTPTKGYKKNSDNGAVAYASLNSKGNLHYSENVLGYDFKR